MEQMLNSIIFLTASDSLKGKCDILFATEDLLVREHKIQLDDHGSASFLEAQNLHLQIK